MTNYTFHWEIKDLMTQFVAALDDVVIKRYNMHRTAESSLHVRYAYAPKERVLYDLANKAQNITIPAICVTINSINRNPNRVFNKISGFTYGVNTFDRYQLNSKRVRMPVPVDISVNVSIITKFQSDMDQILSNFIPYANPYIILSWKFPTDFQLDKSIEIRSEVEWSGSVNLSYPVELNASEKARVIADTSFTIKGWLFPAVDTNTIGNIYTITANLYAVSAVNTEYSTLTASTYTFPASSNLQNGVETVSLSGYQWGPLILRNESGDPIIIESSSTLYSEDTLYTTVSTEIR